MRKRWALTLLTAVVLASAPILAWAEPPADEAAEAAETGETHGTEHGGHARPSLIEVVTSTEFIASVLNFAILVGFLVYFARKPLQSFLIARRRAVEEGMAEGARIKQEAEAKFREYSERLAQLDNEVSRLRTEIREAADKEKTRILEDTENRITRLKQETGRLIEQQMQQLQADVMREVVDTAVASAESVLRDKLNAQDQQRLAREYLTEINKAAKGEGRA
jgi:F-type H+-transporting ATPase subunit b